MQAALVLTSINNPVILNEYFENFQKYDHLSEVQVFMIPDLKTPEQAYATCKGLKEKGFEVKCPSINEQVDFLKKVGFDPTLIPFNSDNRRNVGYLMAVASGADFIISIDDDNYPTSDIDFFSEHALVGLSKKTVQNVVKARSGWFNIMELLEYDPPASIYARGFPYWAKHKTNDYAENMRMELEIDVNAGLWLIDPDLDAISWLVQPVKVHSFKGRSVSLDHSTWSPINTQNTSLSRDAVGAYYFLKMGYEIGGLSIDRFGDIFSGYFLEKCAKTLGRGIRFGTPIAEHKRNSHNYLQDAIAEFACIVILEDVLRWLIEVELTGSTYCETYIELSFALEDFVEKMSGKLWGEVTKGYFHQIAYYMRNWAETVERINK